MYIFSDEKLEYFFCIYAHMRARTCTYTHTHMYAYTHTLVPPFFPAEFRVLILESTCFNNFYGKFKGTLHRMNIYDSCHTSPLYECRYRENCSGPSLQITCEVCVCVCMCVCVRICAFIFLSMETSFLSVSFPNDAHMQNGEMLC